MSVFLGIGLGPIQSGIFMSGAAKGGFKRIVIAEVDDKLKNAINGDNGVVTINIAAADKVYQEKISGVEALNPNNPDELRKLVDAAAEAGELATALPSVKFFPQVAAWLKEGFKRNPGLTRYVYTAENNNHAAEIFGESLGPDFPNTRLLNTVVGKMSGIVTAAECAERGLAPLSKSADRGHLVEEFNKILISDAPGVESRKVKNLHVKKDLYPFEEAKLYGHNAIHLLLGLLLKEAGGSFMSEARGLPELMAFARAAFIGESGAALCKKWAGVDELFTAKGFEAYADDLLVRMTNPFLKDAVDRITRDPGRKLSWEDRIIGTMRVALSQGVVPEKIARGGALASAALFGPDRTAVRKGFDGLWPAPWTPEHEKVCELILKRL